MEKERIKTGSYSFFGDHISNQIVPQEHFLRKLNQIISWERFTKSLIKVYKGGRRYGCPPLCARMDLIIHICLLFNTLFLGFSSIKFTQVIMLYFAA